MFDLAILGLGGVGAAVACHATRRGLVTVGIDREEPGRGHAASNAPWRGFRATYFRDPRYVHLAQRSKELWLDLERDSGEVIFEQTGALLVAQMEHPALAGVEEAGRRHGLAVQRWTRGELEARTPLRAPAGFGAVLEEGAGLVRASVANAAHLRLARGEGLVERAPWALVAARREEDGWLLESRSEVIRARRVLVAAGAGSAELLERFGAGGRLPFTFERHPEQWFAADGAGFSSLPPFNVIVGEGRRSFHGHPVPTAEPSRGMMIARHRGGLVSERPEVRGPDAADEAEVRAFADRFLDGFGAAPRVAARAHSYCNLPNDDFAVGPVGPEGLWVASGLSGHGYKFASALGEGIVERLVGDSPTVDFGAFDPARFVTE